MKHKDTVLVTTIYHPSPGMEKQFVAIWNKKLKPLAYKMGAHLSGLYHNEESDEFLSTSHWASKELAEKFLFSNELRKVTEEVNRFCLIPATREMFDILKEAA